MPKFDLKKIVARFNQKNSEKPRNKYSIFNSGKYFEYLFYFIGSWWHILLLMFVAFLFLYYPIGGLITHKIDKTTNYEIESLSPQQSATVEVMSFLINREVNEKMWTPNLPFFFPSYFLDNMPNFQLGVMSGVSTIASAMASRVGTPVAGYKDESHLKQAADLLKYNGRIWMFSPTNRFTPVPSAHTQYRKARKQLIKFNQNLNSGHTVFYKSPADLAWYLKRMVLSLKKSLRSLESQIREENDSFIDSKADDVFYYNQGKLYAFYLLQKALGQDYKEIIVKNNLYQTWTQAAKALEDGVTLDACYIRNGRLDALTAPNHLSYLAFYTLKSIELYQEISLALINVEKGK